jgi:hypothetical protein
LNEGVVLPRIDLVVAAGLLAIAACAQGPGAEPVRHAPRPAFDAAVQLAPPTAVAVNKEADRLRAAFLREIPPSARASKLSNETWIALARAELAAAGFGIDHPQLIVAVDRNPRIQELGIVLAQPTDLPWQVIGGSRVSTGQAGRRGYFITPTGVFLHTADIVDYRALGTFNENRIRGLGIKGMRVWDFGWQIARKGWLPDGETGEIRLLMHATDPDYLEQRLGRPASQGCVRIPASMNRFLDVHGVLDAAYERAAAEGPRIAAVLLAERTPTTLAGQVLVIVDSSQQPPTAPLLDRSPVARTAIQDVRRECRPDRPV